MSMTGVQIFKYTPKKNCRKCGFPTCMAFAMKVASGDQALDTCPYMSEDDFDYIRNGMSEGDKIRFHSFVIEEENEDEESYVTEDEGISVDADIENEVMSVGEIHSLTPQTNCGKCANSTCLSFALQVSRGRQDIYDCPCLSSEVCEFISSRVRKPVTFGSLNGNIGCGPNGYTAASIGGRAVENFGTVNKLFDEARFGAARGHGFAAERANNLYDRLTGHDARIVGDNNLKNGADRIVDGIEIQSKYCKTGSKCISECFEDGKMRYTIENGTKPMQIEVPSDKYEAAVQAMENRIRNGEVPGVTNPAEAKNIVRKGHFTYEQVKNIAKAGTVESISYDAVNGAIIATSALGVSAMVTFATSLWNGEDLDIAVKSAAFSGLKVGGTAFVTSVLSSQMAKAGLNSALVSSSEAIVSLMGPKASAVIVNAFRSGGNIYGAAAMKSAAKLLRGNTITAGVTVAVMSSVDIVNMFRGRISGKQMFKNLANTTSTVAGGTAGWIAGATLGSVVPVVGTIIGGLAGSIIAGSAAGKVSGAVLDSFIEDDADEMVRIIEKRFSQLAIDYLLNQNEAETIIDNLSDELSGNILKDMYASCDRNEFADNILVPIIENVVARREKVYEPLEEQLQGALREIFEDIADEMGYAGI